MTPPTSQTPSLTFAVPTASPVQDILEKDEFTLSELLEEDELLQEVKAQNKKLIDLYVHAPCAMRPR